MTVWLLLLQSCWVETSIKSDLQCFTINHRLSQSFLHSVKAKNYVSTKMSMPSTIRLKKDDKCLAVICIKLT